MIFSLNALASTPTTNTSVEYYDDGSYIVTTIEDISSSPGIARPRANTNPAILHRPTAPNRPSRDKPSGNPPSHRDAGYHGEY